jgi:hypothetical protein
VVYLSKSIKNSKKLVWQSYRFSDGHNLLHCKSGSPLYKHMFGFFQIYSSYLEGSKHKFRDIWISSRKTNSCLAETKFMFRSFLVRRCNLEQPKHKFGNRITVWILLYSTVHYMYIRVEFFFHNLDYMGIKRRRILCWFQKYKLMLVTKCFNKNLFQKTTFFVKKKKWKKSQFTMCFWNNFI